MPELTEDQHKAEYLVTEANGTLSRDAVTILSGQNLQPGHVLGKVAVGTATGAAVSGNTGNGAISAVSAGGTAKSGVYSAICIEPASNGGTFEVEDPDGLIVGTAVIGTPFAGPVNFSIADGATDFVAGDRFTITVAAGSGKYKEYNPANTDGSQTAVAILLDAVNTTGGDQDGVVIARHAEVNAAFDALDKALCQLTSIAILDVDTTLTDAQMLGALSMKFTGTLTAGRTITIPAKNKLLVVENSTTGGFTVAVKTPSGAAISLAVGDRKLLYCDGTTFQIVAEVAVGVSIPYDIGGTLAGLPTGGSVVLRYPIPRAVRFPSGMANSRGIAGTVSGATATFSIRKNGTQFATMQFAAGSSTSTFTAATLTDFAAGDVLTIIAPSPADSTLADIGFALAGIRL